jgi:hypothetical protein
MKRRYKYLGGHLVHILESNSIVAVDKSSEVIVEVSKVLGTCLVKHIMKVVEVRM